MEQIKQAQIGPKIVEDPSWGRSIVYPVDESHHVIKPSKSVEHLKRTSSRFSPITSFMEASSQSPIESEATVEGERNITPMVKAFWELPYFQASLFATAIEDTVTQLRILVECNNEMRITKTVADMKLLLARKYEVVQPTVKDELDGIDHSNLGCLEYKLNKLDFDRNYFGDVIISIYIDLSLNRSFKALTDDINAVLKLEKYRMYLKEDVARNKMQFRDLVKQLRQQRNHIKSVVYDADVMIDSLKTKVEDASLMTEIQSRYVNNWQAARTEQHLNTIHDKESVNTDSIEYYKQRSDHEQRIHSEVELLTNIAINETLQKVEEWMDKYDTDIEKIDLKIQIKKNDYQNMLEKRQGLEKTIEKHGEQMKLWIEFKDKREKARQYHDKMTKSAIIVQAWWRGLLVRRQLGPFRPKKKGGAGKKK